MFICLYVKNKGLNSNNFVVLDNEAFRSIFKSINLLDNAYMLNECVSFDGINKNDKSHISWWFQVYERYFSILGSTSLCERPVMVPVARHLPI